MKESGAMMEISCDSCGKKYKIDETRMKGTRAKVKCKVCDNVMVITKPEPDTGPTAAAATEFLDPSPTGASLPVDVSEPSKEPQVRIERPYAAAEEQSIDTDRDMTPFVSGQKIRFGLFGKILIVMLIVSLLPFGVFWFITFKETNDRIRNDTEMLMAQTAKGLGERVDSWIEGNVAILRTASRLPEIRSMERERQEDILKAIQAEYPWMYLVFTVGLDGMNVARSDDAGLKDYSDRLYYKNILEGRNLSWQTLIGKTSKKPALVLAVPINEGNRLVGIMAAAMTLDDISKNIATWKAGKTGYAFLLDEKGYVVAHPERSYVTSRRQLNNHPLVQIFRKKGWTTLTTPFEAENDQLILGHVRRNPYGWTLVLQQEHSEVYAAINKVQMFALTLLFCTILLVLVIAWFSARAIVTPIMQLTDAAERMSLGEMNVKIDIKSKDEIGLLAQAIGRMQTSLRLAMSRLRKKR
jgi:methyl-accepting chemotaxis protein